MLDYIPDEHEKKKASAKCLGYRKMLTSQNEIFFSRFGQDSDDFFWGELIKETRRFRKKKKKDAAFFLFKRKNYCFFRSLCRKKQKQSK